MKKLKIGRGFIGNKNGWIFKCYYDDKDYPNFVSALYKTKKEAIEKMYEYDRTGKFDWYGSAE